MTRDTVHELGSEVAHVRDELDVLLGEFDRRRHEVLDVPLQPRGHALGAGLTVLAFTLAAAGSVGLAIWRRQRRKRIRARTGRLSRAIARMTEHPGRVAAEPTISAKIVTAAASAAVAALVKKRLERGVTALANERPDRPVTAVPSVKPDVGAGWLVVHPCPSAFRSDSGWWRSRSTSSRWPPNSPLWQAPVFWNYVRHRRPCCGGCRASRPPGVKGL